MMARHVELHALHQRRCASRRTRAAVCGPLTVLPVVVNAEEVVDGVNKSTLPCARPGELRRVDQAGVLLDAFEYPFPPALRVFSPEPWRILL